MSATPRQGNDFGLGFGVLLDIAQYGMLGSADECGWNGAASTSCWIDPQEELTGLLMSQFFPSIVISVPLRETFNILAYQALVG